MIKYFDKNMYEKYAWRILELNYNDTLNNSTINKCKLFQKNYCIYLSSIIRKCNFFCYILNTIEINTKSYCYLFNHCDFKLKQDEHGEINKLILIIRARKDEVNLLLISNQFHNVCKINEKLKKENYDLLIIQKQYIEKISLFTDNINKIIHNDNDIFTQQLNNKNDNKKKKTRNNKISKNK